MRAGLTKNFMRISIHAPAKGATVTVDPLKPLKNDFNPRPREGSDLA